jgi:hypothetical protein
LSDSRVILTVLPSFVDVEVHRGRGTVASRRRWFDRGDWPVNWLIALDECRGPLAEMVGELDAAGVNTTIVFRSPGTFVSIGVCPAAAGRAGAMQAARLALSSLASFPLDANPHEVRLLHADGGNKAGPETARFHTIAAADSNDHIAALTRLAEGAGLRVTGAGPEEATRASLAAARAVAQSAASAVLCVGEHQSVLTVGRASGLDLARTIGAGTETLVDGLTRPIWPRNGGDAITLNRDAARRLLGTIGIPGSRQELPGLAGCDGASVLPLLQPALQRIAVEIKQTLRFGVEESVRAGIRLRLIGPGAAIANLGEVLAQQAGIASEGRESEDPQAEARFRAFAVRRADSLPRLLCNESSDRACARGLRRALLAGVGTAAALLVVEGVSVHMSLKEEKRRLAAIESSVAGSAALAGQQEHAVHARALATSLNQRVRTTLGNTPAWWAVLDAIAAQTPEGVRVLEISTPPEAGGRVCGVRGYVRLEQGTDAAGRIRGLVNALQKEPVIESVRLGATSRANIRGHDAQMFELTLTPVALPAVGVTDAGTEVMP